MPAKRHKLTPEITQRICELIIARVPPTVAGRSVVSERSFFQWKAQGEADLAAGKDTKHAQFAQAIKNADAEAEQRCALAMASHAQKTWQALAWTMERRWPERWSRPQEIRHRGDPLDPVEVRHRIVWVGPEEDLPGGGNGQAT